MPTMRSRVDCGLGLTMASFSPTIRLRSVDLPAFGLPATVAMPARGTAGVGEGVWTRRWSGGTGERRVDSLTVGRLDGNGASGPVSLATRVGRAVGPWSRAGKARMPQPRG